jgi:carbonic anhydrase/acetyltransferase-like protein (isoleucine patch superfamily)
MVRELLILGVGVHATEMVEIVERVNRAAPTWNLLGFLSPRPDPPREVRNGCAVLGSVEQLSRYSDAYLVPDNDWPPSIPLPRARLTSLVDPAAFVSRTAEIGDGCVIYPNCFVGLNARLGDRVFCLSGSVINHDDVLEERVVVASGVSLAGSVHVEADCYLGQACTVRQFVRIGRASLIGMGAVVLRDVPPNSVIVGNPGRRLRDRDRAASTDVGARCSPAAQEGGERP